METYESIFIARPNLSDEEAEKLFDKVKGVVQKNGGTVTQAENWGKKKLAYEVKKERKGIYFIFRFSGSGSLVNELERHYRIDDSILKYMTVRPPKGDEGKIPSQTPDEGRHSRARA